MPSRPSTTTTTTPPPLPSTPVGSTLPAASSGMSIAEPTDDAMSDQLSMRSSHSSMSQLSALQQLHSSTNTFATAKHLFDLDTHPVGVVRFAHSGCDYLAMGMVNGVVKVGALGSDRSASVVKEFRGHNGAVTDIDWSSDNLLLLTAGADGTVVVWNVESGQAVRALSLGKEVVFCLWVCVVGAVVV